MASSTSQSDTHVATPFGKHPRHRVRHLADDESVTHHSEHGDQLFHQDASGTRTTLSAASDTAGTATDPTQVPELIAWATWTNDSTDPQQQNRRFRGRFTVPEAPADGGAKQDFVTLALQSNTNPVMILTVSLQWGRTGAGGGEYWGVACWAAIGAQSFFSKLVQVNPGETVECQIFTQERVGTQVWSAEAKIGSQSTGTGVNSDRNLNIAIPCMFEAAEDATCGDYPGGETVFGELAVEAESGDLDPTWTPQVFVDTCGTAVQVESATTVRIRYQ
jgi:hypothetical protein